MFQNGLHRLDGRRLGDALFQHHRFKLFDHLSVFYQLFHETGLHHLAVVGNGIVEGYRIDWCDLRLIADTHPGQRGLTPIFGAVSGLRVRHTDIGWVVTYQRQFQILVDAHAIESLYIFCGIRAVVFVDDPTHTDVRAHFESTWHADGAVASTTPVMVFHRPAVHLHHTTASIDGHGGIYDSVVEGHEERSCLEHTSRFTAMTDGIVHHLVVFAIFCALHVHDGLHITRLHFHQDGHTHLTINEFQLVDKGAFSQILHTHIDGRHDVCAINRREHGDIEVFTEHLTTMHQSVGATED